MCSKQTVEQQYELLRLAVSHVAVLNSSQTEAQLINLAIVFNPTPDENGWTFSESSTGDALVLLPVMGESCLCRHGNKYCVDESVQ